MMTEKLKDYQVLDVLCGGSFYKVKHKVSSDIFAWKAYNVSIYTDEQIKIIVKEVKILSKIVSDNVLRYYGTIIHAPSKTLYFVVEYNSWQSLNLLLSNSQAASKYIAESFIWYLLHELARVCKDIEDLNFTVIEKHISCESVFVDESGELLINCFDLKPPSVGRNDLMRQVGQVMFSLCYCPGASDDKIKEFHYSDDLRDIVSYLTDDKNSHLHPNVILYHPTVLSNLETLMGPKKLSDILIPILCCDSASDANKCDSEKAVELCKSVEPAPRTHLNIIESPIYSNISPKSNHNENIEEELSSRGSLSPTLAALALELPGFVPRSRKPISQALAAYNCPERVSQETLGKQWMTRMIALRQREESLNKRERNLLAKEIISSPITKLISYEGCNADSQSNGITLPPVINHVPKEDENYWVSRRKHKRSNSVRTKNRKSYAYEDLDSSLSADPGDESIIVTSMKMTRDNMPKRNIFPETLSKKVHFTPVNPFTESDESLTLTFYELEDKEGYQIPRQKDKTKRNINNFKYLDLEKLTTEKRAAMQWSHSSPSKQAKLTQAFQDITNSNQGIKRTPSKASLVSKGSNTSRHSYVSSKSQWSMNSSSSKISYGSISERTRSSIRMSLAPRPPSPEEVKKPKSRRSLLSFKTPFKFRQSTKV